MNEIQRSSNFWTCLQSSYKIRRFLYGQKIALDDLWYRKVVDVASVRRILDPMLKLNSRNSIRNSEYNKFGSPVCIEMFHLS